MKIILIPLVVTSTQTVTFPQLTVVRGLITINYGIFGLSQPTAASIVGESFEDAPNQTCIFTMVRPGETFVDKTIGEFIGVLEDGTCVYGSCFASM